MTRYAPSRSYVSASMLSAALGLASIWFAIRWSPAWIAVGLFLLSSCVLLLLALRPPIEIHETALIIGRRQIAWHDVERVDRTGWISPLVVYLTLSDKQRIVLIYPGDLDSANSLLRHLRRLSTRARIDKIPYRQFWGEEVPADPRSAPPPHFRVLRKEDEDEVERLYNQLKRVGNLDSASSNDEK